ncbi:unnamed protein product [Coregonus sp. 'balchen']|nr:unnamed protein product [Coregonus sp. 'balchen']
MRNTLLLVMAALTAVSGQRPICLITAPNIVHLGVEETVTVQLQGATKPTQITLYFLYQTANNKVLSEKKHNSKGLLVYNQALHSSKLIQRNIVIPDVETAGHWKIVATFTNHPMSNSSVEFEVKEYVLPVFEIQDGIASITLPTEDLRGKAGKQGIPHMEGYNLYIAVTALETASGDLEEAESTSVKIVTSPYIIDMSKTKEYFTPGGKFSILVLPPPPTQMDPQPLTSV